MEISEEIQGRLAQFQQLQQQVQYIASQRLQLDAQAKEIARTIDEIAKLKEGSPVFRSIGSLLIKVEDTAALRKELDEQKESLEVRVKTLERQEKHLREQHQQMQSSLEKELSALQGAKG